MKPHILYFLVITLSIMSVPLHGATTTAAGALGDASLINNIFAMRSSWKDAAEFREVVTRAKTGNASSLLDIVKSYFIENNPAPQPGTSDAQWKYAGQLLWGALAPYVSKAECETCFTSLSTAITTISYGPCSMMYREQGAADGLIHLAKRNDEWAEQCWNAVLTYPFLPNDYLIEFADHNPRYRERLLAHANDNSWSVVNTLIRYLGDGNISEDVFLNALWYQVRIFPDLLSSLGDLMHSPALVPEVIELFWSSFSTESDDAIKQNICRHFDSFFQALCIHTTSTSINYQLVPHAQKAYQLLKKMYGDHACHEYISSGPPYPFSYGIRLMQENLRIVS